MAGGRNDLQIRLLGTPSVCVDGRPVEFSTRKAAALVYYLLAHGGRQIDRGRLAGLLWGNSSSDDLARTSLRKALSHLTNDPETEPLIGRDRGHVWFAGDPMRSDLATFNRCISAGTERSYREALQLWRGDPLMDLELGEPGFDDWVAMFRAETLSTSHALLCQRLAELKERKAKPALQIAVCELITRVEPSDADANEHLIRLLGARGDTAAAKRRYKVYKAALADLDVGPPRGITEYVASLSERSRAVAPAEEPAPERPGSDRPTVALVRPHGNRPVPDLFSFAHSEVIHQLVKFRSMRCYERDESDSSGEASASLIRRIGFSDAVDHDYRLLLWDEPKVNAVYLRCINVRRQDTVSCVRLDYEALGDKTSAEAIIASAINSLEQDIVSDVGPGTSSVFGRWVEAYRLLTQLTPNSETAALSILEDLSHDDAGQRLSLVHSSISSILMLRRLMSPARVGTADVDLERARDSVNRALGIDELEPFNYIIQGWMRVQTDDHDRALGSFQTALDLNPYSSRTLIASAEAHAYAGEIPEAKRLAERALALSGRYTPAYFHSYLATIAYLSGELEDCIAHLRRAPENVQSAMLAVAAHQERGDVRAATAARARFDRELRRQQPNLAVDGAMLAKWIVTSNMTRDPFSRRRMFGSLESAGLPVSGRR